MHIRMPVLLSKMVKVLIVGRNISLGFQMVDGQTCLGQGSTDLQGPGPVKINDLGLGGSDFNLFGPGPIFRSGISIIFLVPVRAGSRFLKFCRFINFTGPVIPTGKSPTVGPTDFGARIASLSSF